MRKLIYCMMFVLLLAIQASAGPTTVYFNDFEGGSTAGFTGVTSLVGTQGYSGLGFGGTMLRNASAGNPAAFTTLTLTGLAAHDSIDLNFMLAVIDSWDGSTGAGGTVPPDFFNVVVHGSTVFHETFDFQILADGSYTAPTGGLLSWGSHLGFSGWPDAAYDMGVEPAFDNIAHTGSTLIIDFYASGAGWQAGGDESWAIDNVQVITNTTIPAPGALMLGSIGVSFVGWLRRRRTL